MKILFTCFVLVLFSCDGENLEEEYTEFYRLNESRLGIEIIDEELGIKFKPPGNWNLMPSELSRKTESQMKNPFEKNFSYQPVYLFFNDSSGTLLSIGYVEHPDSLMNPSVKLNHYKNLLSNKFKADELAVSNFKHSDIRFSQFKNERGNFINYKIIFSNIKKDIIQFDCTIPKKDFEDEAILLKACIGSINLIKTN